MDTMQSLPLLPVEPELSPDSRKLSVQFDEAFGTESSLQEDSNGTTSLIEQN